MFRAALASGVPGGGAVVTAHQDSGGRFSGPWFPLTASCQGERPASRRGGVRWGAAVQQALWLGVPLCCVFCCCCPRILHGSLVKPPSNVSALLLGDWKAWARPPQLFALSTSGRHPVAKDCIHQLPGWRANPLGHLTVPHQLGEGSVTAGANRPCG